MDYPQLIPFPCPGSKHGAATPFTDLLHLRGQEHGGGGRVQIQMFHPHHAEFGQVQLAEDAGQPPAPHAGFEQQHRAQNLSPCNKELGETRQGLFTALGMGARKAGSKNKYEKCVWNSLSSVFLQQGNLLPVQKVFVWDKSQTFILQINVLREIKYSLLHFSWEWWWLSDVILE